MKDSDRPFDPDLQVIVDEDGKVREIEFTLPDNKTSASAIRNCQTLALKDHNGKVMVCFNINHQWFWGIPADLETFAQAMADAAQIGRKMEAEDIIGDATVQ